MTPKDVERLLKEISTLLELNGENHFKVRAFDNASRIVRNITTPLDEFLEQALSGKIKGIGKGIQEVLQEIHDTGETSVITELRSEVPEALLQLVKIPGLGAKKARKLHEELKIETIDELIEAGEEGRISEIKGFGGKASEKIVAGAKQLKSYQGKILLNEANAILSILSKELDSSEFVDDYILKEEFDETINNIEISISTSNETKARPYCDELASKTEEVSLTFTISPSAQIEDIKNKRESDHSSLVNDDDITGVIHAHSHYSDGDNSLEEMALACKELGYQYLGITDHSKTAAYAGGLKLDDIKRQHEEVDKLNEELAPFRIFKGIESDILPDGSLDYDEKTLSLFDFIIASVHSNFSMTRDEMTKRVVTAVRNPYTRILGHPTGRLLLRREAYEIDLDAVIEAAGETNTAIEINANPKRLDLSWHYHQTAKNKGVKIAICPDAHSIAGIDNIKYGVMMAKRGGLIKEDVLTCFEKDKIQEFFQKR